MEEHYDLPGLRGCLTSRIRLHDVRVPRSNILGAEGQGVQLTYNTFWASGASIGIFAVAAMRQAFDVAYHYALANKRGGAVPIIAHQSVADLLADAKSRIEAVRPFYATPPPGMNVRSCCRQGLPRSPWRWHSVCCSCRRAWRTGFRMVGTPTGHG